MEDNTLEYFMWGYQRDLRISLNLIADELFKIIDTELKPNVFFLGILVDNIPNRHPICIEPDDLEYSVNSFVNIKSLALQLMDVDVEKKIIHTYPNSMTSAGGKNNLNRSYIEAISKIIKSEDSIIYETEKFISYPTYVEGYLVFVILELQKSILEKYYTLSKDKFANIIPLKRSFIESVINSFLIESSYSLNFPNNSMVQNGKSKEEILKVAANNFMVTISQAGGNLEGLNGLFDVCNNIAALKYEGIDGIGKIAIVKNEHSNIRMTLELKNPIKIRDYRKVRKFLEITNNDSMIISDSAYIYGLGELRGKYNPKDESIFIIKFINHFKWEVLHDNNPMMVVEYRMPNIPKDLINKVKFEKDIKRIFNIVTKKQINDILDLIIQATKQKHGTMIVISDKAMEEANKFSNDCFELNHLKLSIHDIIPITSIDGAVIMDINCYCFAIGAILDGLATDKGDSSRGARYNSAIRYYENMKQQKIPTLIVVISEDGMINLIPNLIPQIKHSEITEKIENFIKFSDSDSLTQKEYYKFINYFKEHRFYFTESECEIINKTKTIVDEKAQQKGIIISVFPEFKANNEMDNSYYL